MRGIFAKNSSGVKISDCNLLCCGIKIDGCEDYEVRNCTAEFVEVDGCKKINIEGVKCPNEPLTEGSKK